MLEKIFTDPETGFVGKAKMKERIKQLGLKVSKKELDDFYKHNEITQMNKKVEVKQYYRINAPSYSFQIDIIFLPFDKPALVLIDILSRKAFIYLLKSQNMDDVIDKYKEFLKDSGVRVAGVSGDAQFAAKAFEDFNREKGIILRTDVAKDDHISKGNKLGIIDRFTRTFKNMLRQYMETYDTRNYSDVIDKLVDNYNNSKHSTIGRTPNQAYNDTEFLNKLHSKNTVYNAGIRPGVNEGDEVRVIVPKGKFDKEANQFSSDIAKVVGRDGNKYKVEGKSRRYKAHELLKVDAAKVIKLGRKKDDLPKVQAEARKEKHVDRAIAREGIAKADLGNERTNALAFIRQAAANPMAIIKSLGARGVTSAVRDAKKVLPQLDSTKMAAMEAERKQQAEAEKRQADKLKAEAEKRRKRQERELKRLQ
jgi:hypothetical protein